MYKKLIKDKKRFDTKNPEKKFTGTEPSNDTIEQFLEYTIGYGKYKGETFRDIFIQDEGYLRFMVPKMQEHSPQTCKVLTQFIKQYDAESS